MRRLGTRREGGELGPGGGFQAGVITAATLVLYAIIFGREAARRLVPDRLVEAMIADARANGFRIKPDCSYVAAAFQKHPEWADLRA